MALSDGLIARYFDQDNGAFFFTPSDGERLVVRTKNANDRAIPSDNSIQAMNLLRLSLSQDCSQHQQSAYRNIRMATYWDDRRVGCPQTGHFLYLGSGYHEPVTEMYFMLCSVRAKRTNSSKSGRLLSHKM